MYFLILTQLVKKKTNENLCGINEGQQVLGS